MPKKIKSILNQHFSKSGHFLLPKKRAYSFSFTFKSLHCYPQKAYNKSSLFLHHGNDRDIGFQPTLQKFNRNPFLEGINLSNLLTFRMKICEHVLSLGKHSKLIVAK